MNEEKDFITSEDMVKKLGLYKQNNSFLHIVMRSLSKYKETIIGGVIGCILGNVIVYYLCYA